ncbi:uncharacterized protein [Branchiostoma lanceolatum]|uniref:uncharacterized protein isoform X2 n=1 Tax=Branchiostoma lanceolatum TaxID=7740 RepID=UPI003455566C
MESKHRDILQRRLPDIRRDLRVDYVIPQLIERSILLAPMERDINSKESHEERADELIGLLQIRGRNAFAVFCEILRETYPDLADMLQEESSDTSQPRSTLHGGFAPVPAAMTSASTSRSQISVLPASLPIQLSTRRGPSLFIIHAGEDKKSFVRPLHKALLGQKLHEEEIFLDEVSINTGENISDKIMSTLASESLKLVTIVMSNHLLDKYWPRLEYELSLFHQKKFYPIWLDQNTDSFEAFSRKVGSRFPMLKKTLAHRIQYDNIAEDITDVAIKIVQLLSDQCHTGTKRKRQTSEQSREGFGQIKDLSKGNVTEDMSGVGTDTEIPWAIPELKARLELIINSPDLTPEAAERIAEIERKLFTPTVLNDPQVYWQVFRTFLGHSAVILKTSIGSLLLILSLFRISDVDKFYHTYSRTESGSLSIELSKLLVSKHFASVIGERSSERLSVRIHVEHGDYQAIRNGLRKGT